MRVLHALHHSLPLLSGYSIRSSYIVNLQRAAGVQTFVVTSGQHPNGDARRELIESIEYRRTPACRNGQLPFFRERSFMAEFAREVEAAVREIKPDIIHAHSPVLIGLPALRVARRMRIPFVYEIRDLWENACIDRGKFSANSLSYKLARAVESYVLRRADAVVTICDGLRDELAGRVAHPNRLHVIANGVDVESFQPRTPTEELRHKWGLAGKEVVLYAGTFQPYEGLDLLVRAIGEVVRHRPRAHLVIVGGSPAVIGSTASATVEEQDLLSTVRDNALFKHVTFTGRLPHVGVRDMYSLADVLVYPRRWTRTTAVTTPLKPLEAMAMGKAVIVSDVPALKELVTNGSTGLTFKSGDYCDLAAKCCELLNQQALRSRLGAAAREYVVRDRQWPKLVARYQPLYESLLNTRSPKLAIDRSPSIEAVTEPRSMMARYH